MIAVKATKNPVRTARVNLPKPCARCGGAILAKSAYTARKEWRDDQTRYLTEHHPVCPINPQAPVADRRPYARHIPDCLRAANEDPMAQGYEAYARGYEFEQNPRGMRAALLWALGWLAGAEEDEVAAARERRGRFHPIADRSNAWDEGKAERVTRRLTAGADAGTEEDS